MYQLDYYENIFHYYFGNVFSLYHKFRIFYMFSQTLNHNSKVQ